MISLPPSPLLMALVLAVMILLMCWTLHRRSVSPVSRLQLDDLLLGDDGKMSKSAAVMFGAFALTSWTIIYLTITGRLDAIYFGAYLAAWVAPTVTRLIKGPTPPIQAS